MLAEGDTHELERTFTPADVEAFAAVSGDRQARHDAPDESGRYLVHGLLTATLPTAIGGDLEVLADEMRFRFKRPVYTGETVRCRWVNDRVEERADRYVLEASVECVVEEQVVMTAEISGLIWKGDRDRP